MFRTLSTAVSIATILLLNGCTESPKPAEAKTELPKKPAVPTGPIPALTAYYEVYRVARQIAPDIQTASITGEEVGDVKCSEGKYPEWKIVFVSPS
ncbi:MAG TPA: hypothetical protein VHB50_06920, partial [Bryobacteraceae bacterium]|nr:hypothetical protein [Bryobacteraceae bacterium]